MKYAFHGGISSPDSMKQSDSVTLDHVREELAKMLELSRTSAKAVDPTARTWAGGRVTGLEDAIKLIDQVLLAEQEARLKASSSLFSRARAGKLLRRGLPQE